ncbi:hypothetical protein CRD60_00895 [Bifidobacterium aemilianum]|uniref:Uncharacterized protein n=1 Tax=Bifidobacterium aemilianum TaxID=2493120 RepID=A0A366K9T1_9BIFI|nr:hypothetical protein [Bifidobacterium aemilianum]RBP98454.1 hypothetical protein CRD60_00895 [Bifidobacterium aemilianum]
MDLIVTDPSGCDLGALEDYDLDLAYGADENDFTLTFPSGPRLSKDCLVYMDGTEYGGLVSRVETAKSGDATVLTYKGPTWTGLLAERILCPDPGKDYLVESGDANRVLARLLARVGLDGLMRAEAADSGLRVSAYQFDRYTDLYAGVRKMLSTCGGKLHVERRDGITWLSARKVADYADAVDSDRLDFESERNWRPVNHLIGLGEGELRDRARSDWYADKNGQVSQTQSLTGVDEVVAIYDYSNAKAEELAEKTRDKLRELQGQGEVRVVVRDGQSYDIDDSVTGRDNLTGLSVHATISKKIVKVSRGVMSVDYEAGKADRSSSGLSGSAESTPGGRVYYAGDGLTLTGNTFAAQVTPATLKPVADQADQALRTASDLSAGVGQARQDAQAARADAGRATEAARQAQAAADGARTTADRAMREAQAAHYELPVATTDTLGGVKADGRSVTVSTDGTLSAIIPTTNLDATHPVGSIVTNTTGTNPAATYGGIWQQLPTLGAWTYERIH